MNKEEQIEWLKETYEWCKNFDFSKIPEELNEKFSIDDLVLDYSMLWELYKKQIQELTNNWNELEEWLKSNEEHFAEAIPFRETLRKMKEIKEDKE